jgi:hypothetical protein
MGDGEIFFRRMGERFQIKFGAAIETVWSIFDMRYSSARADGEPFTPEQAAWISGFEDGWADHV